MRSRLNQAIVAIAIIVAWAAIALWAPSSLQKIVESSIFLMLAPGYVIRKLLFKDDSFGNFWAMLAYTVAFSLYLMLLGLLMSVFGPSLGISQPLSDVPLVVAISGSVGALAGAALWRKKSLVPTIRNQPKKMSARLLIGWGALLPALAVLGAIRLNNGASDSLTLIMFGLVAVYTLVLLWLKNRQFQYLYPYALFVMGLALLFATSLRGWFITGHDIVQEYEVFQLTSTHSLWSMNWLQNAYTACLSITILPTILAKLTSIPDPYVFKILFQLMFALVPPVIYLTLAKFMPRKMAFLSAFVFITFPTFLTDMPMLCRQETGFLFFFLALLTMFETRLSQRAKSSLLLLMGLGMIFSHYSTSYVAVGIILGAKVLEIGVRKWNNWRKRDSDEAPMASPLSWAVTVALLLTVYLWCSLLTNTAAGISSTIGGVVVSLPKILDSTPQSGAASYGIVGHSLSASQVFQQYSSTVTELRDLPNNAYYPAKLTNKYPLVTANQFIAPLTGIGQWMSRLHVPIYNLYTQIRSGYADLIQVFMLLGLGLIAFRKQFAKIPRQFLLLGIASIGMIALQVLLPSVIDYGLTRLIEQCLIFLAPAVIFACYWLLSLLRINPTWRLRLIGIAFVGFFLVNAGFLPAITGGFAPSMTTSNSGFYYSAYYAHGDEIAGYSWLAGNTPVGAVVNSDEFARRQMITYANIYARATIAPSAISEGAYVYLSYGDTTFNAVPLYFGDSLIYEKPPTAFLNANKSLIYSNGPVRIYK